MALGRVNDLISLQCNDELHKYLKYVGCIVYIVATYKWAWKWGVIFFIQGEPSTEDLKDIK